jgi:1-acyl-sn-glycerol-3-phosphate acyltransferase
MQALSKGFKFGQRVDQVDQPTRNCFVVMSNHQLYLDWLYMWSFVSHIGLAGNIRFMLKRDLMFFPVIGLGMKLMDFIFVSRNWEKDKIKLPRRVKRLVHKDFPLAMCIFPEGTTLSRETFNTMMAHASEKGLSPEQIPSHCLIPRVNGMHCVLNGLNEDCDGVLDVTCYFEGADFSKEDPEITYGIRKLLFSGIAPAKIHMHVKLYRMSEIPYSDRNELSDWMKKRFMEKSARVEEATKNGKFSNVKYQWGQSTITHNPFSYTLINAAVATFLMCGLYAIVLLISSLK